MFSRRSLIQDFKRVLNAFQYAEAKALGPMLLTFSASMFYEQMKLLYQKQQTTLFENVYNLEDVCLQSSKHFCLCIFLGWMITF